ncbi:MAG: hypothetical protein ACK4N5_20540 [Myxococcales bacterium]
MTARTAAGCARPRLRAHGRAALLALLLAACTSKGPSDAEQLQTDMRRAGIESKSLGRFGHYALLNEDLSDLPCEKPLGPDNRICDVHLIGRGPIRLVQVPAELETRDAVPKGALMRIEYTADCSQQAFDFKTFDNVLPRQGSSAGVSVWAGRFVKVSHVRLGEGPDSRCNVVVEVAEPLMTRLRNSPGP